LQSDTWTFDGNKWTLTGAVGPSGRIGQAMATRGNTVVLYGGENLGDTWVFDGATWKLAIASGAPGSPGPRSDEAMATLP
jgi:N-acetylneuraminic acid mutarotase